MKTACIFAAGVAVALAVSVPAAAAAGLAPQPLGALEGGQTVTLDVPGLQSGEVCHGPVKVTVGGTPATVLAAGGVGGDQVLLTVPAGVASGQTLTVAQCGVSGSETIQVLQPVIHTATAAVTVEAGGETAATAGARVTVTGSGVGVMGSGDVLLNGRAGQVQVLGWGFGSITVVLTPSLQTGTYTLSVRTGGGTSNATTLRVLSIADAQAIASGQSVALPWATGGASSTHPSSSTGTPSRSTSGATRSGNPSGGGRAGHGHGAGWPWPVLVGLGSIAAALLALAPWRRRHRVGTGNVQMETTEPEAEEAPAAEPEAGPETGPEGGDTP